jgi:inward rectifier potassium channel
MPRTRLHPDVKYKGHVFSGWRFYYHKILELRTITFLVLLFVIFITLNGIFGFLYYITGTLTLDKTAFFLDYFYFSVVTFASVGYGDVLPTGYGKIIVIAEIFCGILFMGTITGLIFTRFVKTPSPFVWSYPVVINKAASGTFLQVRVTNIIGNDVIDAVPQIFLQKIETTRYGNVERSLVPLPLEQTMLPIVAFSWVISHKIDDNSPVLHWAKGKVEAGERIVAFIHGYDATIGRSVYSYTRWNRDSLVEGEFENVIISYKETGDLRTSAVLDLDRIDSVVTYEK